MNFRHQHETPLQLITDVKTLILFYYKFPDIGCELVKLTFSLVVSPWRLNCLYLWSWWDDFGLFYSRHSFRKHSCLFLTSCKKSLVPLSDSVFSSNDSLSFVFDNKYSAFWGVIILFPTVCADSDDIITSCYLQFTWTLQQFSSWDGLQLMCLESVCFSALKMCFYLQDIWFNTVKTSISLII